MSESELNIWTSVVRDLGLYSSVGATVYIVKYNEPGVSEDTIPFYCVREDMYPIVTLNPNIKDKTRLINEELRKYIDYKLELARTETYRTDSSTINSYLNTEHSAIQSDFDIWYAEMEQNGQVVSSSVSEESSSTSNFDQAVGDAATSIDENIGDMIHDNEETID